jgi:TIR domain
MSGQSPLIFVSYAHGDLDFVSRLAHDLQRVGVTIWQDKKDIRVGVDWSREAERGIKNCTSVLVVLSPKSVESDHVRAELLYAREKQKHIIPVLYEKCTLPLLLVGLQYVDLTGRNYYQGVLRIADSARKPITNINKLSSVQLIGGEKTERRNFHLSWKLSFRRFSASFSVALMGILAIYFVMSQIEKRPIEIPAEPPASIPERTEPPAPIPERAEPPAPIPKRAQPPAPIKAERTEPTTKKQAVPNHLECLPNLPESVQTPLRKLRGISA